MLPESEVESRVVCVWHLKGVDPFLCSNQCEHSRRQQPSSLTGCTAHSGTPLCQWLHFIWPAPTPSDALGFVPCLVRASPDPKIEHFSASSLLEKGFQDTWHGEWGSETGKERQLMLHNQAGDHQGLLPLRPNKELWEPVESTRLTVILPERQGNGSIYTSVSRSFVLLVSLMWAEPALVVRVLRWHVAGAGIIIFQMLDVRLSCREISKCWGDTGRDLTSPVLCTSSTPVAVSTLLMGLKFAPCQKSPISPFSPTCHTLALLFFPHLARQQGLWFYQRSTLPTFWIFFFFFTLNCEWASIFLNLVPPALRPVHVPWWFWLVESTHPYFLPRR